MPSIARDINSTIPANTSQSVAVAGSFIYLKRANVDVKIEVNSGSVIMSQGDRVKYTAGFADFLVFNDSGIDANITFVIGDGDFSESNLSTEVTTAKNTTLKSANDNAIAAGLSENASPAASTKRIVMVANLDSTVLLRVGDSLVSASRGQPLPAGMTLTIETSDDVYIFNTSAGAVNVAVTEIHD